MSSGKRTVWTTCPPTAEGVKGPRPTLHIRLLLFVTLALTLCGAIGCTSKGPSRLCNGFESYATPQDVRKKINSLAPWQETSEGTLKSDPRPAYTFLTMSGPFSVSGVEGHMKLTFYNDRLMSTEFSTARGRE